MSVRLELETEDDRNEARSGGCFNSAIYFSAPVGRSSRLPSRFKSAVDFSASVE